MLAADHLIDLACALKHPALLPTLFLLVREEQLWIIIFSIRNIRGIS